MGFLNFLFHKLPQGNFDVNLNPFTLKFSGKLEAEFQKDYYNSSIGFLRVSFLLGIVYYSLFAFLDCYALPGIKTQLFTIRFLLVCPIILTVFLLSYTRSFHRWWQLAAFITTVVSGSGIVLMQHIAPPLGRNTYYAGIILVLIYCYLLIKLRFIWSSLAGLLIILSYFAYYFNCPECDTKIFTINSFFLLSANLLGMFGGYCLEFYTRKEFYFRQKLQQQSEQVISTNQQLEAMVKDKTQELEEDIARRKLVEESLRESEEKYRLIAENVVDVIWQMDLKLNFTYISPSIKNLFGYTQHEWLGSNLSAHCTGREFFKMARHAVRGVKHYKTFSHVVFEANMLHKDGSTIPVEITGKLIQNKKGIPIGLQGITRDVTERNAAARKIEQSLQEKNLLVDELYHRTKNNMQVIISLLKMQSRRAQKEELNKICKGVINKIHSMSLVHQKLYIAQDLTHINLKEYISEFVPHLVQNLGKNKEDIHLKMNLNELALSIDAAVPLGLVITELITNIFDHAFPQNKKGKIKIDLTTGSSGEIILQIADNGVGLKPEQDLRRSATLGLREVFTIVEYQLRGKIGYENKNGLMWTITLRDGIYKKRI